MTIRSVSRPISPIPPRQQGIFLRSQGEIQRAQGGGVTGFDPALEVILPPHRKNDLMVMQVFNSWIAGLTQDPSIMELSEEPAGWEMIPNFVRTTLRSYRLYWKVADSASEPQPTVARAFLGAFDDDFNTLAVRVAVFGGLDGVNGGITASAVSVYDNTSPANGSAPAISVVKPSSLVASFYFANPYARPWEAPDATTVAGYTKPPSPPFGSNPQTLGARNLQTQKTSLGLFLKAADGDVAAAASDHPAIPVGGLKTSLASYAFISISIAPVDPYPRRQPVPTVQRLGCASEYEVLLTRELPDGSEPDIVSAVKWSSLKWERCLDEISTATVSLPDVYGGARCCVPFGGLRPWAFGLLIERDGQPVWRGPVTKVSRPTRDGRALPHLVVTARDPMVRLMKRLATLTSVDYTDTDAGDILRDIVNLRARRTPSRDRFHFWAPKAGTGAGLTRTLLAREFQYAYDVIRELAEDAVDFTMIDGKLYVWEPGVGWLTATASNPRILLEGPYNPDSGEMIFGTFTDDAWEEQPGWDIDGMIQATWVANAASDSGEDGFRRAWIRESTPSSDVYGQLEYTEVDQLYRSQPEDDEAIVSESAFEQRASSILALRAEAPALIEGGSLSQRAPVDIAHLVPGSIWRLDVFDACYGQLLQRTRLKRVEIEVENTSEGMSERVSPVLYPVGYEEIA